MPLMFGWFTDTPIVIDPSLSPEDSASSSFTALSGRTFGSAEFIQNASVGTGGSAFITDGDADEAATAANRNIAMPVDIAGTTRLIDEIGSFGAAGGGAASTLFYDGVAYDAGLIGPVTTHVMLFDDGTYMVLLDEATLGSLQTFLGGGLLDPALLSVTLGGNEDAATAARTATLDAASYDGSTVFAALASDGIVTGTADSDLIDPSFADPQGDRVGAGADSVVAGAGDDTVLSGAGDDTVFGGAGSDSLTGETGEDSLLGGADSDFLDGGDDNDILIGDFESDSSPISRSNPVAGPGAADSLFGGLGDDTLYGGAGDDSLDGGDGDDSILGGHGNDTLYGGLGNDDLEGLYGDDEIYGGDGNDHVFGRDGADLIYGGEGDDSLIGSIGIDTIYGGAGNDVLAGSQGSDLIYGGEGNDLVYIGVPAPGDIAYTNEGTVYLDEGNDFLDAGDATLRFDAYGGDGRDTMRAGIGDDSLFGGDGDDSIDGGGGNDTIDGGDGADVLSGGGGRDVFIAGAGDTVFGGEGGDDFDTLDLRPLGAFGRTSIVYGGGDDEDGRVDILDGSGSVTGSFDFSGIEAIIRGAVPCFTPGTLIVTNRGDCLVEDLAPGDMVLTRDDGFCPIRWIGRREVSEAELLLSPRFQPVLISQGALGNNLPLRDMRVSPQHRMLVTGTRAEMMFGEYEVLVPAIHLINDGTVRRCTQKTVTYLHVLFDQHQIICGDGAWSESFQPGDMVLRSMNKEQCEELFALFPELDTENVQSVYPAARMSLKAHEARVLLSF